MHLEILIAKLHFPIFNIPLFILKFWLWNFSFRFSIFHFAIWTFRFGNIAFRLCKTQLCRIRNLPNYDVRGRPSWPYQIPCKAAEAYDFGIMMYPWAFGGIHIFNTRSGDCHLGPDISELPLWAIEKYGKRMPSYPIYSTTDTPRHVTNLNTTDVPSAM